MTGSTLDLKKSSFKKVTKLLTAHEKKKLLKTKFVHKVESLVAVDRTHPMYTSFAHAAAPAPAAEVLFPETAASTLSLLQRPRCILRHKHAVTQCCKRELPNTPDRNTNNIMAPLNKHADCISTTRASHSIDVAEAGFDPTKYLVTRHVWTVKVDHKQYCMCMATPVHEQKEW